MTGDEQADIASGRIRRIESEGGVCAIAVRGFLSMRCMIETLAYLDRVITPDVAPQVVVIDMGDIDGFEPGLPVKLVQWLSARARRVPFAIVVTSSPVLAATVRAAELLLPVTSFLACSTRAEAMWIAGEVAHGRRRANTGIRRSSAAPAAVRKQSA